MISSTSLTFSAVSAIIFAQLCLTAVAADPVDRSYHHGLTCLQAYRECDFRFHGRYSLPTFYVPNTPDKAFTPRIVSKKYSEYLGVLNMNNIVPEFILNGAARKITYFGSQRFTPTHFKPYTIRYSTGSGIGHQTFQGNQRAVANGKCIRVYFTSYQILDRHTGNVIDNKNNVPKSHNKCVVFWMRT